MESQCVQIREGFDEAELAVQWILANLDRSKLKVQNWLIK